MRKKIIRHKLKKYEENYKENKRYCINCKKHTYYRLGGVETCTIPVNDYYSKEHMVTRNPSNLNAQNDCLYYEKK